MDSYATRPSSPNTHTHIYIYKNNTRPLTSPIPSSTKPRWIDSNPSAAPPADVSTTEEERAKSGRTVGCCWIWDGGPLSLLTCCVFCGGDCKLDW